MKASFEPGYLLVQLKATDHPDFGSTDKWVNVTLDQRDLMAWAEERDPVLLVLYDATRNRAVWLHVQSHLAASSDRTAIKMNALKNVRIPVHNRLTIKALMKFSRQKAILHRNSFKEIFPWPSESPMET